MCYYKSPLDDSNPHQGVRTSPWLNSASRHELQIPCEDDVTGMEGLTCVGDHTWIWGPLILGVRAREKWLFHRAVVLKLEHTSEYPTGLANTWSAGPHPQSFWFTGSGTPKLTSLTNSQLMRMPWVWEHTGAMTCSWHGLGSEKHCWKSGKSANLGGRGPGFRS